METQGLLDPAPQSWIHSSDLRWFQLCQWRERERNVTAGLRRPRFRTKGVHSSFPPESNGSLQRQQRTLGRGRNSQVDQDQLLLLQRCSGSFHCCLSGPLLWGRGYGKEQAVEFRKDLCSLVRGKGMVCGGRQEDRIGVECPAGTVNKGTFILVLCGSC